VPEECLVKPNPVSRSGRREIACAKVNYSKQGNVARKNLFSLCSPLRCNALRETRITQPFYTTIRFLNELLNAPGVRQALPGAGVNLWSEITDGEDCSVARGIGLAVANSTKYHGLVAETVRQSERSVEEKGDNLILYGAAMQPISLLWVEEAIFFDLGANTVEIFPVEFP